MVDGVTSCEPICSIPIVRFLPLRIPNCKKLSTQHMQRLSAALQDGVDKVLMHYSSNDEVTEDEIAQLFALLQTSKTKELVFEYGLTPTLASHMAMSLQTNTCLRTLDISENELGCDTIVEIAEMLKHNTCLWELNLGGNAIEDEGALAIAEALRVNKTLKLLNLSGNEISDLGGEAILLALREENYGLQRINLFSNLISDLELIRGLRICLDFNEILRVLVTMRSAQQIGRLGKQSCVRMLPEELCRILSKMLICTLSQLRQHR